MGVWQAAQAPGNRGRERLIQRLNPSAKSSDVETLIGALSDGSASKREAAIARLRILGARALGRIDTLLRSKASPVARESALKALEGSDDPRAAALALAAIEDPHQDVAIAALGVLRAWVTREQQPKVLDALTALALDSQRPQVVRLAALDALSELPQDLVRPVIQQAAADTPAARALEDPSAAREWISTHPRASLSELHTLVSAVRERERAESSGRAAQDWVVARGAAHAELARRGSRVALYDLRESFDAARAPLPLDFLTAVTTIGDASCLEALARAWKASPREAWWRTRLVEAAGEILKREKLTGRSAVVKRIKEKYAGFLAP